MKHTIFSLILLFISTSIFAARKEILLNENWMFRFSHQVQFKSEERVNLPHTWNSGDALSGKQDYYRGMGNYTKTLFVKPEWKGKRLFLRFEGVNTIANVFINDVHIGEHRGGYGAFVFEITDKVKYDADNRILVKVNNALQQDVMPLVGDFNFYGGIYRDVNLIITDPVNISLTDYASPGVYLIQNKVTKEQADVKAKVLVSNGSAKVQPVKVDIKIWEDDKLVQQQDIGVLQNQPPQVHPGLLPAGEGEDASVKQRFQLQLLRHPADPLADGLLGQSVIFRAKGQFAGRVHIEKLGAWILEHRAYFLRNLKERQIAGIFPAQIDRACKSPLVVMGDQAVQQTGQGCLAAAGGPAEKNKGAVLNRTGDMLQRPFRQAFPIHRAVCRIGKRHISALNHGIHPLAAHT